MNFMIDALNPGRVGVPDSCSDVDFETPPQTTEFFESKTQSLLRFIRVAEYLLHDWSVLCLAQGWGCSAALELSSPGSTPALPGGPSSAKWVFCGET